MRTKLFSLLGLSVLVLMMFMSFGSATFTALPNSLTFYNSNPQTFTITNTNTSELLNVSFFPTLTIPGEDLYTATFNITGNTTNINTSNPSIITVIPATTIDFSKFNLGKTYSKDLLVSNSNNSAENHTITIKIENNEVCEYDNLGSNLKIKIRDISVEEGFGDDEEWYPFDEIEIEIDVENNGPEDIDDIVVEWGLYNTETNEWVIDEEENDFNLKDGDEERIMISFKLDDVDEFEENGDYIFYVWATGEDDDFDGNETCISDLEPINIIIESDFVVLDNFQFSEMVSCKDDVQITADVWNIGDSDQDDVYVMVYNKELGINEKIEIGDIDDFEDEKLVFEFQVPENAEEKWYSLKFTVYDEDDDVYENDNDDKAEFTVSFKVEGNCIVEPQVMVTASLESGGKAGQELVIKATVANTGSKLVTYELNAIDYSDWATLISIEPSTIMLDAEQSADVLITFNVNKDVSGDKLFNIEVLLEDEPAVTQPVSVTIEKSGFSFITGDIISGGNWYLWGIGALNVILIIVIILVALRVAKK